MLFFSLSINRFIKFCIWYISFIEQIFTQKTPKVIRWMSLSCIRHLSPPVV